MMAEGKNLDIQFPPPYYKLCGTHANYFKSEAVVCIRQRASFQVNCWKEMSTNDVDEMWIHMKEALNLPEKVKEYAMKQVQSQYKNKQYYLRQRYLKKKGRPNNVSPEDWNWLVNNKWNDSKFQERSLKNKANRSKQEIRSITGTKSIIQKAFEMKEDSKSNQWPDAVEVWKAKRMRSNGTWCVLNGEEIMDNLKNVGEAYEEEISKAHAPLAEHFALVLGRKSNHSLGIGSAIISKRSIHKQFIQSQAENAEKRANHLELELQNLTGIIKNQEEANIQLQIELQSQRELIDAQKLDFENQKEQMKQDLEKAVKRQFAALLGGLSLGSPSSGLSTPINDDQSP